MRAAVATAMFPEELPNDVLLDAGGTRVKRGEYLIHNGSILREGSMESLINGAANDGADPFR